MGFGTAVLAVRAVPLMKDMDSRSVDGNRVIPVKKPASFENLFRYHLNNSGKE